MSKCKLIFIGNSPSSGSTMLADLFDSIPRFACGHETRIFSCTPLIVDFQNAKMKVAYRFAYRFERPWDFRNTIGLAYINKSNYGMSQEDCIELIKNSDSFEQFAEAFSDNYLEFRKDNRHVWVEKTPENIYNASLLLDKFPNSYFIQIIRNPLYVFNSLVTHRNPIHSQYMAAATWYIDAAIGYSLKDHARYICIRYEDVVQRPFELISELASKFTTEYVAPRIIEQRFVENSHRQSMDRIESWSVKEYGAIENANDVMVGSSIQDSFYGFL